MGVDDVNGDFHFAKRKLTGTWVNSPMFIQAWKAIRTEGVWASHALAHQAEQPEGHVERYILGELQVRELRLLWQLRGDQPSRLQHLLGKPRGLHQGLELEGEGEGREL